LLVGRLGRAVFYLRHLRLPSVAHVGQPKVRSSHLVGRGSQCLGELVEVLGGGVDMR
jgi:hypothetical protein